jgi:restriction endonuclease S subunit
MLVSDVKNKCFVVFSNELEGRFDPHFYKPDFLELIKSFNNSDFEIKTLKEISEKITSGATPKSGGTDYTSKNEGVAFIRSGDINEEENIDFDDVLYIKKEVHSKKLKSSQLKKGDVLIAIVGATIGEVSVYSYDNDANINQAIALVRCTKDVKPEYVKSFMLSRVGQKQLDKIKRPVARANINLDEIASFKIPVPPLEIQNKIVEIMQSAYQKKEEKELEAENIYKSIEDYILEELVIKIPEIKTQKCFSVNSTEVTENRLDPYFYKPEFSKKYAAIKSSKYPLMDIGSLIIDLKNGVEIRKYSDNGFRYLRVSDLGKHGIINKNVRYVEVDDIPTRIKLNKNDFLISRSGSLGLVSRVTDEVINSILSSHIFKISLDISKLNPRYLEIYLRGKLGQFQFFHKNNGGIIPEINQMALRSIKIVLPPLKTQERLVEVVEERLARVRKIKAEAINEIQKAKQEVEKIILGK